MRMAINPQARPSIGMSGVWEDGAKANLQLYSGHSAEEQAAIASVVNAAAANWESASTANLNAQHAAQAYAQSVADQANQMLCDQNDNLCGSSPCFPDANRNDPTIINAAYDHLGISCADPRTGVKRWFPRNTPAAAIAATFDSHTNAETVAESDAIYGRTTDLTALARANGMSVAELTARAAAMQVPVQTFAAALPVQLPPAGNSATNAVPTAVGTSPGSVQIGDYSVSPLMLGLGALAVFLLLKGGK